MTPAELLRAVVRPTLASMGERYAGTRAELMLLAIAQQESACTYRRQLGDGPACGLWQLEPGGGVAGVLRHERTASAADATLARLGYGLGDAPEDIAAAMTTDDALACAFARLLLWSDPAPLPPPGEQARAWLVYRRLWRPGKPRPADWPHSYRTALAAVTEGASPPPAAEAAA